MKKVYFTRDTFIKGKEEAERILKYMLLLDLPEYPTKASNLIEEALDSLYEKCIKKIFFKEPLFFGESESLPGPMLGILLTDNNFYVRTIQHHCLIAAYDIFSVLNDSGMTTAYSRADGDDPSQKNTATNNLLTRIHSHKGALQTSVFSGAYYFDGVKVANVDSDEFYQLLDINGTLLKRILNYYRSNYILLPKDWDSINSFLTYMLNRTYTYINESPKKGPAEQLLYRYRFESRWGIGLLKEIIKKVNQCKDDYAIYPDGINELTTIALLNRFPNVFSRHLYLEYCFSTWGKEVLSNCGFFNDLRRQDIGMQFGVRRKLNNHEWFEIFRKFCNFFTNFVFPVCEWYFVISLFQYEKGYIKEICSFLKTHIEKHTEEIMNPFPEIKGPIDYGYSCGLQLEKKIGEDGVDRKMLRSEKRQIKFANNSILSNISYLLNAFSKNAAEEYVSFHELSIPRLLGICNVSPKDSSALLPKSKEEMQKQSIMGSYISFSVLE